MAASKKRKHDGEANNKPVESGSDNASDSSNMEEISEEEVMVDFEARAPDDGDFHGMKGLLKQLFPKANIDISQMANFLIEQSDITSILKQCIDETESDDDMESEGVVFGILSAVNMTDKKDYEFHYQLRSYLLDKCRQACKPEKFAEFEKMLNDEANPVGLILSERFINIPSRISLPLYNSLSEDIKKAVSEEKPFDFKYYMLISKFMENDSGDEVDYTNVEDELFYEDSIFHFDYSVAAECDSGLGGTWNEDDAESRPKRRIMLLPAAKWETFLSKLKHEFEVA